VSLKRPPPTKAIAILQKTDFPVDVVLKDPSANK
jgi:hypothetical protein